jgi:hypothetical protein
VGPSLTPSGYFPDNHASWGLRLSRVSTLGWRPGAVTGGQERSVAAPKNSRAAGRKLGIETERTKELEMILFGISMNPKIRLIAGAAALALGIVAHLAVLEIAGAAFLAIAVCLLVRGMRKSTR